MTCADTRARLSALVDGELADGAASAVRGHLRTCAACADELARERAVVAGLAELDRPEPPAALWAGIQAELAQREHADAARGRWWLWWQAARRHVVPAALATTAVALGLLAWSRHHATEPATSMPVAGATAPVDQDAAGQPGPAPGPGLPEVVMGGELSDDAEARYRAVVDELLTLLADDRASWPAGPASQFERDLAALRQAAAAASPGRARARAYQAVISFLQDAALAPAVAEVTP
ncbi:MAG: zf-HC2 domain-containing protein [Kofleriaceae bacterium]|nr:zf-HC2 domain-containing protein [Kofleriaceae bacterium]